MPAPATTAAQVTTTVNTKSSAEHPLLIKRASSMMSVDMAPNMSRVQSKFEATQDSSKTTILPGLTKQSSTFLKLTEHEEGEVSSAEKSLTDIKVNLANDSFLKPPTTKPPSQEIQGGMERKVIKPPRINVVLPPKATPDIAQDKTKSSLFGAMAKEGITKKELFGA